jgi:pyruvate/2-oxoglutarate dehydrogenase complex dihydrolipoamide dehydrogenase (E3) component
VPDHLVVLGGGYIGLEQAQAFRRLSSRVTVVERNAALIHREDPDVTAAVGELLRDEGIEVFTGTTLSCVEGESGEAVRLSGTRGGAEVAIEGTHLLAAAGRTPNTDGIGLERAGIETDSRGHVKVNERLQTTAAGVWAVGDCAGSPYFTHVAYDDFRVVRDNLAGGSRVTTGRQVPFCLFTDPELARVGLSEREAGERGITYRLAKIPMGSVLRTRTLSETRGFMKALVEADGDRILGSRRSGWRRGGDGRRSGGDGGRPAVHRPPRRGPHAPDHRRGVDRAALRRPRHGVKRATGVHRVAIPAEVAHRLVNARPAV